MLSRPTARTRKQTTLMAPTHRLLREAHNALRHVRIAERLAVFSVNFGRLIIFADLRILMSRRSRRSSDILSRSG